MERNGNARYFSFVEKLNLYEKKIRLLSFIRLHEFYKHIFLMLFFGNFSGENRRHKEIQKGGEWRRAWK
jgi:hypothetical protein